MVISEGAGKQQWGLSRTKRQRNGQDVLGAAGGKWEFEKKKKEKMGGTEEGYSLG